MISLPGAGLRYWVIRNPWNWEWEGRCCSSWQGKLALAYSISSDSPGFLAGVLGISCNQQSVFIVVLLSTVFHRQGYIVHSSWGLIRVTLWPRHQWILLLVGASESADLAVPASLRSIKICNFQDLTVSQR